MNCPDCGELLEAEAQFVRNVLRASNRWVFGDDYYHQK